MKRVNKLFQTNWILIGEKLGFFKRSFSFVHVSEVDTPSGTVFSILSVALALELFPTRSITVSIPFSSTMPKRALKNFSISSFLMLRVMKTSLVRRSSSG